MHSACTAYHDLENPTKRHSRTTFKSWISEFWAAGQNVISLKISLYLKMTQTRNVKDLYMDSP